ICGWKSLRRFPPYPASALRNQPQALGAIDRVEALRLEREAHVAPLHPSLDAIGVMRAGRVTRLPGALQADQRRVAAEVDDDTHRGDQPGIELLSPAVRRNVQRAVVAAGRIGAAIEIAADGIDPAALAGWHVGRQLGGARCPGIAVQLAPLPGIAV